MLTLPLDPTDDLANPAFKNAAACAQWLGQLQLTNLHQAHGVLRMQLGELNRYPMSGQERLQTLELLRETVAFIQSDYAKKLVAKKLPLNHDELSIFVAIIELWQGMSIGYRRCLQACIEGDALLTEHGALLCQRCLLYSGLQIFEHMRTGYEFDGKLWLHFHQFYVLCEKQVWQLKEVRDDLNGISLATTCNTTYIKTLLACHAHRADLPRHLLHTLDHWLTLWSPTVSVERRQIMGEGDASSMAVDLERPLGLQLPQLANSSEHIRYLGMASLGKLIRANIMLLQQGKEPHQLGLGEGCNTAECVEFLNYLHQCWCEGRDIRMSERRDSRQQAQLCYGLESCFAYIANQPFKQPVRDGAMDTLSRKQLSAFGRVLSDTIPADLAAMGFVLETWQIEDESNRGSRLLRDGSGGVRLCAGQLIAMRQTDSSNFKVGSVSWVKVTQSGQPHAGVRYLSGLAQAVSMKATGINLTVSGKYFAALVLPAEPVLNTPPSLLAPRDWFKAGRVVEIVQLDKKKLQLKMELSLEKGADYERISFTEINT